jgi:hypothetical protein
VLTQTSREYAPAGCAMPTPMAWLATPCRGNQLQGDTLLHLQVESAIKNTVLKVFLRFL